MKSDDGNAIVHGAGAGLLALLGMLGRCVDDAARIGVSSVDDVGRACTNSVGVNGPITRSGDNLSRSMGQFHVADYVDDLRFDVSTRRVLVNEGDETALAPHVAKQVTETTFRIIDLSDDEKDN